MCDGVRDFDDNGQALHTQALFIGMPQFDPGFIARHQCQRLQKLDCHTCLQHVTRRKQLKDWEHTNWKTEVLHASSTRLDTVAGMFTLLSRICSFQHCDERKFSCKPRHHHVSSVHRISVQLAPFVASRVTVQIATHGCS